MNPESTENLKFNLALFITGLTSCAFALGVISLTVYYSFFNFNVFDYLELNEIITHVIRDGVLILIPYCFLSIVSTGYAKREINGIDFKSNRKRMIFKYVFLGIFSLMWAWFFYEYYVGKITLPILLTYILSGFSVYIFDIPNFLRKKLPSTIGFTIDSNSYLFFWALTITVYGGITHSLIRADGVKNLHSTIGTYIVLDKQTIKSDSNYYFIGRTNKYLFFFNSKNKFVDVYPDGEIKKAGINQ